MANQWFKLYGSEYLSDPKILQLNGNERSCWITLMCLASQTKDGVVKFLSESQLLLMSGVSEKTNILQKFEEMHMIELCNGNVTLCNWTKRQYSESINRVRDYRAKQKSNAEETTEENRIDKNRIELPIWLDKKVWGDWEQHRKELKKKLTPLTVKKQINFLSEHRFDHIAIINKSIQNGWAGLFALKGKSFGTSDLARETEKVARRADEISYEAKIDLDNRRVQMVKQMKA